MVLQQAGNIEFKTVRGTLARARKDGFSHMLVDEDRRVYLIETGRTPRRLDHLVGMKVEIKGLVETDLTPEPKIYLIHFTTLESFQRVI